MSWPTSVCFIRVQIIPDFGKSFTYAHAFPDDNELYVSFQPDSMSEQLSAVTVMENCIDDIKTWMLNDKLKLNDGKTDFFIIGTGQQHEKVNFDTLRIGDSYVTASSKAKDLGFWFVPSLHGEKILYLTL